MWCIRHYQHPYLARCTLSRRSTDQPSIALRVHTFSVVSLLRSSIPCAHRRRATRIARRFSDRVRAARYCNATTNAYIAYACDVVTNSARKILRRRAQRSTHGQRHHNARRIRPFLLVDEYDRFSTIRRQHARHLPWYRRTRMGVGRATTLDARAGAVAFRKDVLPGHTQSFGLAGSRRLDIHQTRRHGGNVVDAPARRVVLPLRSERRNCVPAACGTHRLVATHHCRQLGCRGANCRRDGERVAIERRWHRALAGRATLDGTRQRTSFTTFTRGGPRIPSHADGCALDRPS